MKSAQYPVSANGWQRILRERVREAGQTLREPCQCPTVLAQLLGLCLHSGDHLSSLGSHYGGFWVCHLPPAPLFSVVGETLPTSFLCLHKCAAGLPPRRAALRENQTLFLAWILPWCSSKEVVAFCCAKCLFLESTQPQSCLIDFSYCWGKAIYSFYLLFPLGKQSKAWSIIRKS